jgi:hypothetical protein
MTVASRENGLNVDTDSRGAVCVGHDGYSSTLRQPSYDYEATTEPFTH